MVHALFEEDAWAQLTPLFARIMSTDAVPHPSNRIGLASLIADALSGNRSARLIFSIQPFWRDRKCPSKLTSQPIGVLVTAPRTGLKPSNVCRPQ